MHDINGQMDCINCAVVEQSGYSDGVSYSKNAWYSKNCRLCFNIMACENLEEYAYCIFSRRDQPLNELNVVPDKADDQILLQKLDDLVSKTKGDDSEYEKMMFVWNRQVNINRYNFFNDWLVKILKNYIIFDDGHDRAESGEEDYVFPKVVTPMHVKWDNVPTFEWEYLAEFSEFDVSITERITGLNLSWLYDFRAKLGVRDGIVEMNISTEKSKQVVFYSDEEEFVSQFVGYLNEKNVPAVMVNNSDDLLKSISSGCGVLIIDYDKEDAHEEFLKIISNDNLFGSIDKIHCMVSNKRDFEVRNELQSYKYGRKIVDIHNKKFFTINRLNIIASDLLNSVNKLTRKFVPIDRVKVL
jgi:hypothetical protein